MTEFERLALDSIALDFGPDEADFRAQVSASRVIDRIDTIVGFYTRVRIDRSACRQLAISFKSAIFDVQGVDAGLGVVLWGEEGYLDTIEGFTFLDKGLAGQNLAELKFLGREPII